MPENLTRRQFMTGLGITGTAAAALALGMSEITATASDRPADNSVKHPYWWVKEVDKPTIEIDWSMVPVYPKSGGPGAGFASHFTEQDLADRAAWTERASRYEAENRPGYRTKDQALYHAMGVPQYNQITFGPPADDEHPSSRGASIYTGSPEDNLKMIQVALRSFGAMSVGVVELETDTTRKLMFRKDGGYEVQFQNIDFGYDDTDKQVRVYPEKARWAIVWTTPMSVSLHKSAPSRQSGADVQRGYQHAFRIAAQTAKFLRILGYGYYGITTTPMNNLHGLAPFVAFATLAGLGELGRLHRLVTPETGPMVRLAMAITDLPLAPTKPIDFGHMRFCESCMLCANVCHAGALSTEKYPTWTPAGDWNYPGKKAFFESAYKCNRIWPKNQGHLCTLCFSVCPYTVRDSASIHQMVKAAIATTGRFDPMLVGASRAMTNMNQENPDLGTPLNDPEHWWNNTNMALFSYDSRVGGKDL